MDERAHFSDLRKLLVKLVRMVDLDAIGILETRRESTSSIASPSDKRVGLARAGWLRWSSEVLNCLGHPSRPKLAGLIP